MELILIAGSILISIRAVRREGSSIFLKIDADLFDGFNFSLKIIFVAFLFLIFVAILRSFRLSLNFDGIFTF